MKAWWLVAVIVLCGSCANGSAPHEVARSVGVSPTPTDTVFGNPGPSPTQFPYPLIPSPSPVPPCTSGSNFGLVISSGHLQVIDTCGKVKASAPISLSSVQACSPGGLPAVLEPPVSATSDRVYYRDGDTKIRYLTPDGQTGEATTVPGSATTVSFFSVTPDDSRIAVLVEDISPASTINLRLYEEDVQGGGHHVELDAKTIQKDQGYTLWPMGWHQGLLVLAMLTACSANPDGVSPAEWHVFDPTTDSRKVTITNACATGQSGILSRWPSAAGVACSDFNWHTSFVDWTGASGGIVNVGENSNDVQSGLSPSGRYFFFGSQTVQECGTPPSGCMEGVAAANQMGSIAVVADDVPCLWIDDNFLLTPRQVLEMPALPAPITPAYATAYPLPAPATCAGRFPGTL